MCLAEPKRESQGSTLSHNIVHVSRAAPEKSGVNHELIQSINERPGRSGRETPPPHSGTLR